MKRLTMLMVVLVLSVFLVGCNFTTPEDGAPGAQGEQGEIGETGPAGPAGPACVLPELEIGLVGIEVLPATMNLEKGSQKYIESVFAIYDWKAIDLPISFEFCTFTTENALLATVSSIGVVTAVEVGTVKIVVKYRGMTTTILVMVE